MDTSSLGWIIFFYGPVLVVLYLLVWQLSQAISKTVRVLQSDSGLETTKNRKLSWLCIAFIILGLLFLYALIFTKEQVPLGSVNAGSSVFDNKWGQAGLSFYFFLSAIITSWLIHPLQKPRLSRFDKYLGIGWIRRHKILTQLAVFATIIIGVIGYQLISLELNKRAFAHARAAIDTVYADIVKDVGAPDNYKRSSTCSQSYVESIVTTKGPIGCDVGTNFIYSVRDQLEATVQFKKIQEVISKHDEFRHTKPLSGDISSLGVVNSTYKDAQDFYQIDSTVCTVKYVYDTPEETYLKLTNQGSKTLYVTMGCYGPARQLYYPSN